MGLPGYSVDQLRDPELSPMLNDLSGLPPALFSVGGLDLLRDESILMARRRQLAGSRADLDVWPEGDHAFITMATPGSPRSSIRPLPMPPAERPRPPEGSPVAVVRRFLDEVVNGGRSGRRPT